MKMKRRRFVTTCLASAGSALVLGGMSSVGAAEEAHEISANEDTMREHALLGRILVIYEEAGVMIDRGDDVPTDAITDAAELIHEYIGEYHETKEEEDIFPHLREAGRHVALVNELERQHRLSRMLTDRILRLAATTDTPPERDALVRDMRRFSRMYRPHAAHEDTVVLPALQEVMTPREYAELGEAFEEHEHELFGDDPFGKFVKRVADMERSLGVHDISRFSRL
ncbi:MAG: hemerythrin domain-containing protein [Armatimonadota bacterium]